MFKPLATFVMLPAVAICAASSARSTNSSPQARYNAEQAPKRLMQEPTRHSTSANCTVRIPTTAFLNRNTLSSIRTTATYHFR